MLKAILFDLGGTLFDFAPMRTRRVFEGAGRGTYEFLKARGHALPPYKAYFRKKYTSVLLSYGWSVVCGRDFNCFDLLGKVCRRMDVHLDDATLRDLAWQWYSPMTAYSSVAPDVIPALRKFRDRGYALAIVSNTFIPGFCLDKHLEHHGLLEFFPHRIYSSEIGHRKPHRRPFDLALAAVDATPEEVIFVGDTVKTDIVGARRMGIRSVFRRTDRSKGDARRADHVVREISELHRILPALGQPQAADLPDLEDLAYET